MVADNKALLPYGDSVAAPVIKPDNIDNWKQGQIFNTNKYFKSKFEEIKQDYLNLMEEFKWNEAVYNSEIRFTPIKGNTYHLYEKNNGTFYLSILSPEEWDRPYVGSFRLESDDKWHKI